MSSTPDPMQLHRQLGGKIAITSKLTDIDNETLGAVYTPGVAQVSRHLAAHPGEVGSYTMKSNLVAVVSDGSAVLGLGNVGPQAALPVMEGKAMLFERLSGVNAFPLVLDTQDMEQIIATVRAVAPVFGGINLEDIAAPKCYEIEQRLQEELNIPVMHDDQHATAIVVQAGLLNACRVTNRSLPESKVVIIGAGAAGSAVTKLLHAAGVEQKLVLDSQGILHSGREGLDIYKQHLVAISNPDSLSGGLAEALSGADIVIGVSGPDILSEQDIAAMADDPIVFALSNPTPEIMPERATAGGAAVVATGRSDFANQINNVLVFPGLFRGLLDSGVPNVTDAIKLAAATGIAEMVSEPRAEYIIPTALEREVAERVAAAVAASA